MALACAAGAAHGQDEGIFADFRTSMGAFTVRLDYERAPRAVAGFVGLATGEQAWADPQGNIWNRPFYDGTIFHRVVKDAATNGIAIQGGGIISLSVDTNTGVVSTNFSNAGYQMLESVTNGLFHSNGVISMANSGPNTDGSQFFITSTNVPGWDGSYSVFGHVVSGQTVVAEIADMPVQGRGSRPVTDVVLSNVTIRREGVAAETFDIHGQGVPIVESGPMRAYASGDNLVLEVELAQNTETLFRESDDLNYWEPSFDFGVRSAATLILTNTVLRAQLGDTYFFHASRIRYPIPITTPLQHRGKTYTFTWFTTSSVMYEAHFGQDFLTPGYFVETTGGNVTNGQLLSAAETWSRGAYSARLVFLDSRNRQYQFTLGFNPEAITNRFTGLAGEIIMGQFVPRMQLSGTFTVE